MTDVKSAIQWFLGVAVVISVTLVWMSWTPDASRVYVPPEPEARQVKEKAPAENVPVAPPDFYAAFVAGGPIATGELIEVKQTAGEASASGSVVVAIAETLRGASLPEILELPFERHSIAGASVSRSRPRIWDSASPEVGKRVCVILAPQEKQPGALCVFDLEGSHKDFLAVVQQMLEIESPCVLDRRAKLLGCLKGSSPWVRAFALERLLATEAPGGPDVRSQALSLLQPLALESNRPLHERLQAVSLASFKIYDGFASDDPVNYTVLSLLADLLPDPDVRVRGEVISILHGYLLGAGTLRPDPRRVTLSAPAESTRQLRKDSDAQLHFSQKARELLALFGEG